MATYLRTFNPNYAGIAAALHAEASKRGPLPQTTELVAAFEAVKSAIDQAVELNAPVPGHDCFLYVDASDVAAGAALFQLQGEQRCR